MSYKALLGRQLVLSGLCAISLGCANTAVYVPTGHMPAKQSAADTLLPASFTQPMAIQAIPDPSPRDKSFELPRGLPGSTSAEASAILDKNTLPTLPVLPSPTIFTGEPWTLARLQDIAFTGNPALRKIQADADAAYGVMVQAGLYPNPTVGYQADQMQPWANPRGNAGQQGAFYNQLIKTAGKLGLAQQVAGYDYLNAMVAVRRAHLDLMYQVRTSYFSVLVAQQAVEVNRSLVTLADEVYELQRKQLRAGEAAAYEPLQLYAQAVQARNNLVQAEQTSRVAWKQLAASLGQPALPQQPLVGKAESTPPLFDFTALEPLLADHTDVMIARNKQLQADSNLQLQQVTPYPDIQTNVMLQYDNVVRTTQFGVQLGVALPLFDRNQGGIHQAYANIASNRELVTVIQNDLAAKLSEARGRYETSKVLAANYRDLVLPNLAKAYRAMIRRYQVEPDKVQFNDIVVAQQNLAQSLQAYLGSLDAQWKAVVDVANVLQLDDLYAGRSESK